MKNKILKRDYYTLNNNNTAYDFGFKKSLRIQQMPTSSSIKTKKSNYTSALSQSSIPNVTHITPFTSRSKTKIILTNDINECPCEEKCPNYRILMKLKRKMQQIVLSNKQLTEVNEYLSSLLSHKDGMYKQLLNENAKIRSDYTLLSSHMKNRKKKESISNEIIQNKKSLSEKKKSLHRYKHSSTSNDELDDDSFNNDYYVRNFQQFERGNSIDNNSKITKKQKSMVTFSKGINQEEPKNSFRNKTHSLFIASPTMFKFNKDNIESYISPLQSAKTLNYADIESEKNDTSSVRYYDRLSTLSLKNKYKTCSTNISFLAASSELLNQMSSNPILKELYNLAQQDDTFLEELNNIPKQKIILFCDVISSVTKEYQELIKLISRVKAFLKSSINLVDSVLLEDSTMVLINNTCNILNCERASLFIYDRFTDMLVLNTAEGLKKNEIKVPKDKGIVGSVFMSGEKLKIDDAYHDVRFNKDVDKKTNFRTRNILCYPLKDKDGDTFGAIQAINKANGPFDTDDLELMEIFSAQASAILKNMMNMGETTTLISKMKILVQFSNEMYPISDKRLITEKCEEKLMLILYSTSAKIYFCNKEKNVLEHYEDDRCDEVKPLGILGYVWKKKEIHGCSSVKTCKLYNNLVDLRASDALITFPIIDDIEVIAICQAIFPGKLGEVSEKPKDTEMIIIDLFEQSFLAWYNIHFKH